MKLLKETEWVKVWQTRGGIYVDSKWRWGGAMPPDAAEFIEEWDRAEEAGRAEMEAAFSFYPYERTADIDAILGHMNTEAAKRMRAAMFTADSDPSEALTAFLEELAEHFGNENPAMLPLGENQYYSVQISEIGLHFDSKVQTIFEIPGERQLLNIWQAIASDQIFYRRAAKLAAENPWLIEPNPAEHTTLDFQPE